MEINQKELDRFLVDLNILTNDVEALPKLIEADYKKQYTDYTKLVYGIKLLVIIYVIVIVTYVLIKVHFNSSTNPCFMDWNKSINENKSFVYLAIFTIPLIIVLIKIILK